MKRWNGDEQEFSDLEMIQRLYEDAAEHGSPLPRDRTGGLRFRRGVPEALLHLSRNNRSEVARLAREVKSAQRQALAEFRRGGSISTTIALLYWHSPDFAVSEIADGFGVEIQRVQEMAEANPTVEFRCLDCATLLHPQSREHFRQMTSALRMLDQNPHLLREYLYTGLHCESCMEEREERWGEEWVRQEHEYQQRLLELRAMPYEEYLRSPEWRRRRERKLEAADHRCQLCNRHRSSLDVHHRTYENFGEELDSDLIVVCRACHDTFHKHRGLGR